MRIAAADVVPALTRGSASRSRPLRRLATWMILLAGVTTGCAETAPQPDSNGGSASAPRDALVLVDDRGDTLRLPAHPERVISLVPAVTEAMVLMGARPLLVGRTDYDTLDAVADLPSVGGGLGPNLEVLRTLAPELVISFAGESDVRTGPALAALGIAEFAVRPDDMDDVPRIMVALGRLAARPREAAQLVEEMESSMEMVRSASEHLERLSGIYLLGGAPPLAAGPGTFISDLLALAGVENALSDLGDLYAPVSPEVLISRQADIIVMSEGTVVDERILEGRRVVMVPAWVEVPGPRLGRASRVVAAALRPELADRLLGEVGVPESIS